jgi:uncharacterized protein YerC
MACFGEVGWKLEVNRHKVQNMLDSGTSYYLIGLELGMSSTTVSKYIKLLGFTVNDDRIKRKVGAKYA